MEKNIFIGKEGYLEKGFNVVQRIIPELPFRKEKGQIIFPQTKKVFHPPVLQEKCGLLGSEGKVNYNIKPEFFENLFGLSLSLAYLFFNLLRQGNTLPQHKDLPYRLYPHYSLG